MNLPHRNMLVFQLWDPDNLERSVDIFVREPLDFDTMVADAVVKVLTAYPYGWHPFTTSSN